MIIIIIIKSRHLLCTKGLKDHIAASVGHRGAPAGPAAVECVKLLDCWTGLSFCTSLNFMVKMTLCKTNKKREKEKKGRKNKFLNAK